MGTTSIKLITSDDTELSWGSIETDRGVLIRSGTEVINTSLATIDTDGNLSVSNNVVAGNDVFAGNNVQAAVDVFAGNNVVATGNVYATDVVASGTVYAGDVVASDDVFCDQLIVSNTGTAIFSSGDISMAAGKLVDGFDISEAMPRSDFAAIYFGLTPTDDASVVVTGQTWVTAISKIKAWVSCFPTDSNTEDDHEALQTFARLFVRDIVPGVGFTIQCNVLCGLFTDYFWLQWEGVP